MYECLCVLTGVCDLCVKESNEQGGGDSRERGR